MPALSVPQAFGLAVEHHGAGRLAEAEALYRQILAVAPNHSGARHHLGIIAQQTGRNDLAVEWIGQAIALDPGNAAAYANLGEVYRRTGRLDEAIANFRRALELQPDYPEILNNLANALLEKGEFAEAMKAYRRALELHPDDAKAHYNLGKAFEKLGQFDEAIIHYRQILAVRPNYPPAYNDLGNVLKETGQLEEAMAAYRRALEIKPDYPPALLNVGNLLKGQGLFDEAIIHYRRAIESKPDYPEAHNNLGNVFKDRGQLDEAIAAYRQTLILKPDLPDTHTNLGNALKDRGQLDEAVTAYRHALDLAPERPELHSNLIYGLHYHPGEDYEAIAVEHQRWNRQIGGPLHQFVRSHTNERNPERRLRVGYVSPDFRDHAIAFFIAPLLPAHDRERHEIFCYASVFQPDAVTKRLRKEVDVWREAHYLSDARLAEYIREDGIDILVDLTMHTSDNRLAVFARRPAPVQVSWLGYPGSTGVEAISYRLSDAHIDPIEPEEFGSSEQVVRLPDAWCCYEPIADFPPVGALPAAKGRDVTFGSLNHFAKTNEALLACWAGLLRAVPNARLLMICPAGQAQERTRRQFAERGVAPERLELVAPGPWADYIRLCERIDVALDTYPCNGMTTTCHALWMGLPVVTRAGERAVSRASLSLLETLGLPELVAQTEEEYVRIAVELANDLARLAELRATLRPRMAASPLMDAPRFARNIEAAYRTMWRRWCREGKTR